MRKIVFCISLLVFHFVAHAQNNPQNLKELVGRLAADMKVDPNNPLKIDPEWLGKLAGTLPDGQLKARISTYASQLGADKDLSYRQVYWDVYQSLNANPQAATLADFANTRQSLDVLLNRSGLIVKAVKGDMKGINMSTFTGDPAFMGALTKMTGSSDLAQNIGSTLGIGIEIIKMFKADRERKKKFVEDYKRFAELSTAMSYAEVDGQLARSLIDATVSKLPNPISAIYSYDFKSGARLYNENGVMMWRNAAGTITKKICLAERRNDGKLDFDYSSQILYTPGTLVADEDSFILMPNFNDPRKCPECLLQPVYEKSMGAKSISAEVRWVDMSSGKLLQPEQKTPKTKKEWKKYEEEVAKLAYEMRVDLDKTTNFIINGKQKPLDPEQQATATYGFPLDLTLLWDSEEVMIGERKVVYLGSLLYVRDAKTRKHCSNLLPNKVAAVTYFIDGMVLLVGANGAIAKVNLKTSTPDELVASVEQQLAGPRLLPSFNFTLSADEKLYAGVAQRMESGPGKAPELFNSPDNTVAFYINGTQLGVVRPDDLSKSASYAMTFPADEHFFGRENGDYTLHLAGYNEFSFPVIKKYSVSRLIAPPAKAGPLPSTSASKTDTGEKPKGNSKKNSVEPKAKTTPDPKTGTEGVGNRSGLSIADELQKLKVLYDNGALTNDEYNTAKKKLLQQ